MQFGCGLNYLIDVGNAVIVDVEATPARTYDEVEATKTMIDRTKGCFDLKPKRLIADTAYGTEKFLGWLVKERRITPLPVSDKSQREDGTFSRSDFKWDKRRGMYIFRRARNCGLGGSITSNHAQLYRAQKRDCDACSLKARCCPSEPSRKIPRDVHEDARDVARRKMTTKAFARSRDERKRVEMRTHAHLAEYLGLLR